ncbi:MAG TPA: hypothetical protein VGE29_02015 [Prosthecobacter sp.]
MLSASSVAVSLALFAGALVLAFATAQAFSLITGGFPRWLRGTSVLVAKAIALFPLSALLWSAVGLWVGRWGLPVASLMPAAEGAAGLDTVSRAAWEIWWWAPPVFLLALPLAADLGARLTGPRRANPWPVLLVPGWLGLALLPVVEEALHLPGALAGVVTSLRSPAAPSVLVAVFPLLLLMLGWWVLVMAWPCKPPPHLPTADDRIFEGAIAIGFSPEEAWRLHLRTPNLRRRLANGLSLAASLLAVWTAYGCPGDTSGAHPHRLETAFQAALHHPEAPLLAAWPYALCALSLWLLGRIIQPRHR